MLSVKMEDLATNAENVKSLTSEVEDGKSLSDLSNKKKTGVAAIKSEFLLPNETRTLDVEYLSAEDKKKLCLEKEIDRDGEVPEEGRNKRRKYDKIKLKGQNKKRPPPMKVDRSQQLCISAIDVAEGEEPKECPNKACEFQHDVAAYLANKPPDIGDTCYVYDTYGRCTWGVTCRFGSQHITANNRNKVDVEKWNGEKYASTSKRTLAKDVMVDLRKHKYSFDKSEKILQKCKDDRKNKSEEKERGASTESVTDGKADPVIVQQNRSGCITDEDVIALRPEEKKKINWKGKLYLSPLTTVGNLPFRRICKEFGADVTCGEMALATPILQGSPNEWALTKRHSSEDLFGIQICGSNQYVMTRCAQILDEKASADFIDINLGCPIDMIYTQGGGSGLLRRGNMLQNIVSCMDKVLTVPLTVKTRTGVQMDKNVAHTFMPMFKNSGVSLVTLHGRSREQRYTKSADWDYIDECAKTLSPVPLFGNGDVLSYEEYEERLASTSVSGIMIGRGALMKPWIFTEIKERRHWDISSRERLDLLRKYANYGMDHFGSDTQGVERTRRFMLEWLSFLHRYIPVGLLERLPQRINERPPVYKGRDELETLLASPNCGDWIKISEMLLGPVPDNFAFLPKHKANSWR